MKKILIAVDNDFTKETYSQVFKEKNFEVLVIKDGKEAFDLAKNEKPDVILADVALSKMSGFELLEGLRKEKSCEKIPVIIFSQLEKKEDRNKAIELEAKDFISAATTTPIEAVRRVKIVLGEQKSYRIAIQKNLYNAKELITDFGYIYDLKCPQCSSDMILYLIRDLSIGENYFKVSFICPECNYSK